MALARRLRLSALDSFLHGTEVFYDHLAAVRLGPLAIAVALHLTKIWLRTHAWRNIVAAAYPDTRVRRRSIFGGYVAGVGVNAIAPARGGDLVKLALVKRRVEGSTYPTLGATLLIETLFDFVVALALFAWALQQGVLPGLGVLPRLPGIDWSTPARHPAVTAIVAIVLAGLAIMAAFKAIDLKRRVAQGFAIVQEPRRYLREVVTWQAASWVFRIAALYWFLKAFRLEASIHNSLLVQIVQSLSTLFPVTPGGAGTEQGLLVYVFHGRLPATPLLSFSVGMRIALTIVNVAVGFGAIAVMTKTLRWRKAVDSSASAEQPSS